MVIQAVRDFLARVKQDLGLDVYSFSVFHVFFEQYLTIGHDALVLLTIAVLAVTAIVYAFTASLWASAMICTVLVMILVCSFRFPACPACTNNLDQPYSYRGHLSAVFLPPLHCRSAGKSKPVLSGVANLPCIHIFSAKVVVV